MSELDILLEKRRNAEKKAWEKERELKDAQKEFRKADEELNDYLLR